jgi:hypothetical protein
MTGLTDDILSNSAEKELNLLNINALYPIPRNSLIFSRLSKIFSAKYLLCCVFGVSIVLGALAHYYYG